MAITAPGACRTLIRPAASRRTSHRTNRIFAGCSKARPYAINATSSRRTPFAGGKAGTSVPALCVGRSTAFSAAPTRFVPHDLLSLRPASLHCAFLQFGGWIAEPRGILDQPKGRILAVVEAASADVDEPGLPQRRGHRCFVPHPSVCRVAEQRERQMFQHVAGIDAIRTAIRDRQALKNVAVANAVRKARRRIPEQPSDRRE